MNEKIQSHESKGKEIKKHFPKKYSVEEKNGIVIEGIKSKISIEKFCQREGINTSLYYKWSKDFQKEAQTRLNRYIRQEASTNEVDLLKNENMGLKCIRRTLCTPLAVIICTPQTFFN